MRLQYIILEMQIILVLKYVKELIVLVSTFSLSHFEACFVGSHVEEGLLKVLRQPSLRDT